MRQVYLEDDRPWAVGFSGGKDSTVALCEVIHTLESVPPNRRNRRVYVTFSDTGLEPEPLFDGIHSTLDRLEEYARERRLPVTVLRVRPRPDETLLAKIVGEGMTLPDRQKRWCTDRMKIQPQKRAIGRILEKHDSYIAVTGARSEESADRAKRLERSSNGTILYRHETPGCAAMHPIRHLGSDEVWSYLFGDLVLPFVDARWLAEIYADASGDGDECSTMVGGPDGEKPGCSRSGRFGCVVCPLSYGRDRMLQNLSEKHPWLASVIEFRDWLMEYQHGRWEECRDVYNHRNGKILRYGRENHRKGMVSPGGFSLDFRKRILERLAKLDEKLEAAGRRPLLTDGELRYVQERWILEGDTEWSAFSIYGRNPGVSEGYAEIAGILRRWAESRSRLDAERGRWEAAVRDEWRLDSPGFSVVDVPREDLAPAERTLFGWSGPAARTHEVLDAMEREIGIEEIEALTLHEKMALLDDGSLWE